MLDTEQIKMPQSKLQKTDYYQPVVALFLYCQQRCFSLSAASPSLDQRVQKLTETGRKTASY